MCMKRNLMYVYLMIYNSLICFSNSLICFSNSLIISFLCLRLQRYMICRKLTNLFNKLPVLFQERRKSRCFVMDCRALPCCAALSGGAHVVMRKDTFICKKPTQAGLLSGTFCNFAVGKYKRLYI